MEPFPYSVSQSSQTGRISEKGDLQGLEHFRADRTISEMTWSVEPWSLVRPVEVLVTSRGRESEKGLGMGNKGSQLSNSLALLAINENMDESKVFGFPLHLDKIVFVEIAKTFLRKETSL